MPKIIYNMNKVKLLLPTDKHKEPIEALNKNIPTEFGLVKVLNYDIKDKTVDNHIEIEYCSKKHIIECNDLLIANKDTYSFSSFLCELELNINNIFSMHSSGLAYGSNATLIIGFNGSGKTTTAVKAALLEREVNFISGSRIFVEDNHVLSAIPNAIISKSSYIYELGLRDSEHAFNTDLTRRIDIDLTLENLRINKTYPVCIKDIVIINKLPIRGYFMAYDGKKTENIRLIYESMLKFSNRSGFFYNNLKPFSDLYPDEVKHQRIEYASRLANNVNVIHMAGDLDLLANNVIKLVRG